MVAMGLAGRQSPGKLACHRPKHRVVLGGIGLIWLLMFNYMRLMCALILKLLWGNHATAPSKLNCLTLRMATKLTS